jgi:hypothetical protein
MQCTKCGAELQPGATVCPSCEARVVLNKKAVAAPRKRPMPPSKAAIVDTTPRVGTADPPARIVSASRQVLTGGPAWLRPALIAAVVLVVVGVAGWFVFGAATAPANTPEAAALRFWQAYADYDANGMRANSAGGLDAADAAATDREQARLKAEANGAPRFKDIKVTRVEERDANTRVVYGSVQMLESVMSAGTTATVSSPPTYGAQTPSLTVILNASGKWLVSLGPAPGSK